MSSKYCRLGGTLLSCLLGASIATNARAQEQPATASSPPAPYSPLVSFKTLPALQAATPIPGSPHVPGDFNGDGTSDLLWINPTLNQVGYWTMSAVLPGQSPSVTVTRTGARTINVTPGYFVGAVGDFNNDGYADLVFTSANRDLWLWTNNHQGGFTSTEIGTYPSQWQLVGAGDIDGDGYDDLLWLDPSDCQFAYWTMQGAVRTGYKIIPVACGYYPIGVGYYTPSNRLSILWTSPANDLYIWDSTGSDFKAYNLTSYFTSSMGTFASVWAIGGGYMGKNIGVESNTSGPFSAAIGNVYSRTFDSDGNQTGFVRTPEWDGGIVYNLGSGGYLIQGNGVNATGLYALDQDNDRIISDGLSDSNPIFTGNAPIFPTGFTMNFTYPDGWRVVGAPGNGTAAPPWQ
jgi:hypothetical protein